MKLKILCIYCFADYLKLLLANDYNYYGTPTKIVQILDLSPANKTCSTLKLFPDSGKKKFWFIFCNRHWRYCVLFTESFEHYRYNLT